MNEELQAANEELETWKEELQLLNEELITVNSQLVAKVDELQAATSDLSNLLANTDIATVVLDRQLRVRSFTPATNRLIDILPSDVGRPIQHFAQKFTGGDLVADASAILERLVPLEHEVQGAEDQWYIRRTLPYRTRDNRIEGVVVTFLDITERKRSERALEASNKELKSLNESLERRVEQRTSLLRLQQEIADAANESETIEEALSFTLRRIAEHRGWAVGHAYLWDEPSAELVPSTVWHVRGGVDAARFRSSTMNTRFGRGHGHPGVVMETRKPLVVDDVRQDPRWLRDDGRDLGAYSAIFLPVAAGDAVEGVLEFYSEDRNAVEPEFLAVMTTLGIQLGYVLERRKLEREIAQVVEREQREIGQELHDHVGQDISAISMLAQSFQKKLAARSLPDAQGMTPLIDGIEKAKVQLRRLTKEMVPLELGDDGLPAALEDLAERFRSVYTIACSFTSDGEVAIDDRLRATQLFRIAQEAVRNAVDHAKATQVEVQLRRQDNRDVLEVRDNGGGFEREGDGISGVGLRIMRHRATLLGASLDIVSERGTGTVVRCVVPRKQ